FPHEQRERVRELCTAIARALRSWFVGRLLSMTVIGIGTGIGLWIAGVPLAVPLGLLAGIASFVPNLGPILSALPGILVGLSASPQTALWALLVYVGVQMLESYLINPFIEQRVVSLPPVLLLAFEMLMGLSAGVIGLFMATPLLVSIVVIGQALYLRDMLEDDVVIIGQPHCSLDRRRRRRRIAEAHPDLEDHVQQHQLLGIEPLVIGARILEGAVHHPPAAILAADRHRPDLVGVAAARARALDPGVVADVDVLAVLVLDDDLVGRVDARVIEHRGDRRQPEQVR